MPRLDRLLLPRRFADPGSTRSGGERGDVPGWVLITAMTVALLM
jgi:hypothetical protein